MIPSSWSRARDFLVSLVIWLMPNLVMRWLLVRWLRRYGDEGATIWNTHIYREPWPWRPWPRVGRGDGLEDA